LEAEQHSYRGDSNKEDSHIWRDFAISALHTKTAVARDPFATIVAAVAPRLVMRSGSRTGTVFTPAATDPVSDDGRNSSERFREPTL
jgi:hypothetical protein